MRSISLVCLIFLLSSITANADVVSGGQPNTADLSGVHMLLFAGTPANTPFVPKLPDTGQTTSYTATFGEDSDYTINPPSYTDNGDGTVSDNNTGLMWQQEDDNTTYNWYQATGTADATYNPDGVVDVCGSLTTGGYNDWRVPAKMELMLLVNYGTLSPAIDTTYFPGTNLDYYWISTSEVHDGSFAWNVHFNSGNVSAYNKSNNYYVRCVRGEPLGPPSFTDNGNGTVTDGTTGLMWQQNPGYSYWDWEDALRFCESLNLAGATDWRLPNIKELLTINDESKLEPPAIDTAYFPGSMYFYLSSTSVEFSGSDLVWYGNFYYGPADTVGKIASNYYARCVRGGQ